MRARMAESATRRETSSIVLRDEDQPFVAELLCVPAPGTSWPGQRGGSHTRAPCAC